MSVRNQHHPAAGGWQSWYVNPPDPVTALKALATSHPGLLMEEEGCEVAIREANDVLRDVAIGVDLEPLRSIGTDEETMWMVWQMCAARFGISPEVFRDDLAEVANTIVRDCENDFGGHTEAGRALALNIVGVLSSLRTVELIHAVSVSTDSIENLSLWETQQPWGFVDIARALAETLDVAFPATPATRSVGRFGLVQSRVDYPEPWVMTLTETRSTPILWLETLDPSDDSPRTRWCCAPCGPDCEVTWMTERFLELVDDSYPGQHRLPSAHARQVFAVVRGVVS